MRIAPSKSTPNRRARRLVAAAAVLGVLIVMLAVGPVGGEDARADPRPNIVLIVTDDQTLASFSARTMPRTKRFFAETGTEFRDAIVTTPLCCPSRATMLTGQYAHNHRVLSNKLGYPALKQKRNVLPVWLQEAGYNTIHIGKFLHRWTEALGDRAAPGWTEWHTLRRGRYFDYGVSRSGWLEGPTTYGQEPADHVSLVLNGFGEQLAGHYAAQDAPFYLQFDAFAPHYDNGSGDEPSCRGKRAIPAPEDVGRFRDMDLPRSRAFNERNTSDKLRFVQTLPPITPKQERQLGRSWRCALEAALAVDRGFEQLRDAIEAEGELDQTAFIFVSDNGFAFGEHRALAGKQLPFEEMLRVPLLVSLPQAGAPESVPRRLDVPVANLDIAPTILDLAGARPCAGARCRSLDGRSMVGPLTGDDSGFRKRALAVEYGAPGERNYVNSQPCSYRGIRVNGKVMIEHTRMPAPGRQGRCSRKRGYEFYNLKRDPGQLHNRFSRTDKQRRLLQRLRRLARCEGTSDGGGTAGRTPSCD